MAADVLSEAPTERRDAQRLVSHDKLDEAPFGLVDAWAYGSAPEEHAAFLAMLEAQYVKHEAALPMDLRVQLQGVEGAEVGV